MGLIQIKSIAQMIGTKPKRMKIEYNTPTLWTTISMMIDEFERGHSVKICGAIKQVSSLLPTLVDKQIQDKLGTVNSTLESIQALLVSKSDFNAFLNDLRSKFGNQDTQIKSIEIEVDRLKDANPTNVSNWSSGFDLGRTGAYNSDFSGLDEKYHNLARDVNYLKEKLEQSVVASNMKMEPKEGRVKFASLGFQDMGDAIAFVNRKSGMLALRIIS